MVSFILLFAASVAINSTNKTDLADISSECRRKRKKQLSSATETSNETERERERKRMTGNECTGEL